MQDLEYIADRIIEEIVMAEIGDWLSRLLKLVPVSGKLDYRCFLGAPWQIDFPQSEPGEMAYHVILGGSALLEDAAGEPPRHRLVAGDILLFPHGTSHVLRDGSGAAPRPAQERRGVNLGFHENDGTGERLDMMCGRFLLSRGHERLIRAYLPRRLVLRAAENSAAAAGPGTRGAVVALVGLMRAESAADSLGGLAVLNALSTAFFALVLRLASETLQGPEGLLAVAGNPRLAPALTALFGDPAHPWTLPELAQRCNMSRATFIRHFQERLGRSAAALLADIRMTVAANALARPDLSTGAVAELAGYQSDVAFQRAFKQQMGVTPAQWRREARQRDSAPG